MLKYYLLKYFPFFCISAIIIFFDLTRYFKRHKRRTFSYGFGALMLISCFTLIGWVLLREEMRVGRLISGEFLEKQVLKTTSQKVDVK